MTIRLRAMEPEDLDVIYNIENDLDLWTVGYANAPYSRYLLHDYVANATSDIYADRQLRLMAENDEGEVVGIVDLSDFEPRKLEPKRYVLVYKKGKIVEPQEFTYCLQNADGSRSDWYSELMKYFYL